MHTPPIGFLIFALWTIGIIGINVYLTSVINSIKITTKGYIINFIADIGVSATAGAITYLLAKTLQLADIYLVMVAAIIGHLSARVAYQSSVLDLYNEISYTPKNNIPPLDGSITPLLDLPPKKDV